MPFDPRFMIDVMYPAATSAYLMMTVHAPPLPAGYTLVGSIEADPRAATTVAALTDAKLHEIVAGMLAESKVFGLVAWNEAEKTALVSFRGTQSIWDWINDLDAIAVAYTAVAGSGRLPLERPQGVSAVPSTGSTAVQLAGVPPEGGRTGLPVT